MRVTTNSSFLSDKKDFIPILNVSSDICFRHYLNTFNVRYFPLFLCARMPVLRPRKEVRWIDRPVYLALLHFPYQPKHNSLHSQLVLQTFRSYECWYFSDKLRYNETTEMSPTDVWMTALDASRSLHSVLFPSRHTWSASIICKCLALLKAVMWRTVPTSCEWNVISLEGNIGNYDGGGSVRPWRRSGILSLASVISTDALDWWDGGKPHNGQTDKARIAVIRTADANSFRVASVDTSLRK